MRKELQKEAAEHLRKHPAVQQVTALLPEWTDRPFYLVGGALRDCLLRRPILDFDFVLQDDAQILAESLSEKLGARYVLLDEQWGVARLIWRHNAFHEPVTLDFATMQGTTIQEDLLRRDFTLNALALQLPSIRNDDAVPFLDPAGGLKDLEARRIRMARPLALQADPVRMLRAFRLAAALGFRIEPLTLEAIRKEREGLLRSAAERIGDELFKFLACRGNHAYLVDMDRCGLLSVLVPELDALKGLAQGPYHHRDAWEHTLETYRYLEQGLEMGFEPLARWEAPIQGWMHEEKRRGPLLKLAALLHDIEKPHARSVDPDGTAHFYGHARSGAETAARVLERVRASRADQERMRCWVQYHMGPLHLLHARKGGKLTERAKIRFLRRLGHNGVGVMLLALSDLCATRGARMTEDHRTAYVQLLNNLFHLFVHKDAASLRTKPMLNGNELMEALELPPGPLIGRLLRLLEEARIQGQIQDRSSALDLARSLLAELDP